MNEASSNIYDEFMSSSKTFMDKNEEGYVLFGFSSPYDRHSLFTLTSEPDDKRVLAFDAHNDGVAYTFKDDKIKTIIGYIHLDKNGKPVKFGGNVKEMKKRFEN